MQEAAEWKLPNGLILVQDHSSKPVAMETRMRNQASSTMGTSNNSGFRDHSTFNEGMRRHKEQDQFNNRSSFSAQVNAKKTLRSSYFSLESMALLVCLTASLLILPLILPPLPPPPFLLLLLPIGIFAVLMILAFMPSNVRDLTYTCM